MKKDVLIIVDPQNDFITGSLAVNGAKEAMLKLCNYLTTSNYLYEKIIITLDYHPINHCSFKDNGGSWPAHCVEGTFGAEVYAPLMTAIKNSGIPYSFYYKGFNSDKEEYGAFEPKGDRESLFNLPNTRTVRICGIATDYCVKETFMNLLDSSIGPLNYYNLLQEFCAGVNAESSQDFLNYIYTLKRH